MNVDEMLTEREERYGSFESHARIAQAIKNAFYLGDVGKLPSDMKEALDMIAHKMARVINGDPYYADNWIDIAGYATLIINSLKDNNE